MKEQKSSSAGGKLLGALAFLLGLVLSMVYGWVIFPNLLYSQKAQPINFSHAAHTDSECDSCHLFRSDGTYAGIPTIDKCKECHESAQGNTESEKTLVEQYIANDRELPWRVYAWQPDNVYFSHAPHKAKDVKCVRCHRDVSKEAALPAFREDRLTGYSVTTMKMIECESCHAESSVSNNCEVCHK